MPYKWLPIVLAENCNGCGLCVEACGPRCLEIVDNLAVLARADDCGSEEHCIPVCEQDAIHMAWEPAEGNPALGRWRALPPPLFSV